MNQECVKCNKHNTKECNNFWNEFYDKYFDDQDGMFGENFSNMKKPEHCPDFRE